jgi:hypothetical protein
MAFAYTINKNDVNGLKKVIRGTWSGAKGDASGTVVTGGTNVIRADFLNQAASAGPTQIVPTTWTNGTAPVTVTVHNRESVTNGVFEIEYQ